MNGAPVIEFPTIEGDPANWIPNDEQLRQLQMADLIIVNGASAEQWMEVVTLDEDRIHSSTATITDRLIVERNAIRHQHGPDGEHSHDETASTTWLDPQIAVAQATEIARVLAARYPDATEALHRNLERLITDLTELDKALEQAFQTAGDQPILFSRPVYQYLERRYGLNGASLKFDPDRPPGAQAWSRLQIFLLDHPAKIMLWEAEPLPEIANKLTALGVRSVVFDSAANVSDGNFISIMQDNVLRIDNAFTK